MTVNKKNTNQSILIKPPFLDRATAQARFENFKKKKLATIENCISAYHDSSRVYEVGAFTELLKKVVVKNAAKKYIYTGMRVYFACYMNSNSGDVQADQQRDQDRIPVDNSGNYIVGQLTLIFVPTFFDGQYDKKDSDLYYIFSADGSRLLDLGTEAEKWISEYRNPQGICDTLSKNKFDLPNGETKCLWYFIDYLQATLNDIMNNPINSGTTAITAFFGAYPQRGTKPQLTEFVYGRNNIIQVDVSSQLTIVFGTGPVPFVTESNYGSPFRKFTRKVKEWVTNTDYTDYDTGAPCPPAVGCDGGI